MWHIIHRFLLTETGKHCLTTLPWKAGYAYLQGSLSKYYISRFRAVGHSDKRLFLGLWNGICWVADTRGSNISSPESENI